MPRNASCPSLPASPRGAHHRLLLMGLVLGLSSPAPAAAEVYKWTDAEGKLHFGDRPPVHSNAESVGLRVNTFSEPEIVRDAVADLLSPKRKVVLYSAQWCGVCNKARAYLRSRGIPFEEYDVEGTAKGREDFARLGGRGVPIILVGEGRMNGFSPDGFSRLYEKAGR